MTVIKICTGRACTDHGSQYLFDRIESEGSRIKAEACPCMSECRNAVNVKVESNGEAKIHPLMTGPKLAALLKKIS